MFRGFYRTFNVSSGNILPRLIDTNRVITRQISNNVRLVDYRKDLAKASLNYSAISAWDDFYGSSPHRSRDSWNLHQKDKHEDRKSIARTELEIAKDKYISQYISGHDPFTPVKSLENQATVLYDMIATCEMSEPDSALIQAKFEAISRLLNKNMIALLIANRSTNAEKVANIGSALGLKPYIAYQSIDEFTPAVQNIPASQRFVRKDYADSVETLEIATSIGTPLGIHPVVGFHAEDKKFSESCEKHGYTFFGPNPAVMDILSNKANAKEWCDMIGINTPRSYNGEDRDSDSLCAHANEIGYPVMLKLKELGGGGRGNRVAIDDITFRNALKELKNAPITIEKLITDASHIELQFVGNTFVGVRDCSMQLNYQKGLERNVTNPQILARAVNLADKLVPHLERIGYCDPLTVEFLFTADDEFFIECNTRLQVEHPLTEFATGLNIVEWSMRNRLGRSYYRLQELYGDDFQAGLREAVLRQMPVRQIRVLACDVITDQPREGEILFSGLKGSITGLSVPQNSAIGCTMLGVNIGTDIDYINQPLDPQIGAIYGFGDTQAEADHNAITLAQEFKIEIDGQSSCLNLDFACRTLEYVNRYQIEEKIDTWSKFATKYATAKRNDDGDFYSEYC